MDTIGSRIKKVRELRGYTQKQVANSAKINVVLFQQYEYGLKKPKDEQLRKISQALDVDPAFLQPSKLDSPMAIYSLMYDLIEKCGDISLETKGDTAYIGIKVSDSQLDHDKISRAKPAHEELSLEDFKKWLIDQPKILHNGEFAEKGK